MDAIAEKQNKLENRESAGSHSTFEKPGCYRILTISRANPTSSQHQTRLTNKRVKHMTPLAPMCVGIEG